MSSQPYENQLFIDQEQSKMTMEVVNAFREYLDTLPSSSKYVSFLADKGFYLARSENITPTSAEPHADNARTLVTTDASRKVFVPGLAKHAFNSGAAKMNGMSDEYAHQASLLAEMAREVSFAIGTHDLNLALEIIYKDEWVNYMPDDKPKHGLNNLGIK